MKRNRIKLSLLAIAMIGLAGCGSSSTTNPNTGAATLPTDGDFVGLSSKYTPNVNSGYEINHWQITVNDAAQTFSAYNAESSTTLTGTLDSTGAYLEFEVTGSNSTDYAVGYRFSGVGISDTVLFVNMPPESSVSEFITLVKEDSCPTDDLEMVWHRIVSPVLANQWVINDIIADLSYQVSTQSLQSTDSWTTQAGTPAFSEASFLNHPTTLSCTNGVIQGTQSTNYSYQNHYDGYMTTDGYMVIKPSGWDTIEFSLPKKQIEDINATAGNYTGYLIVNTGNGTGLKGETSRVTAHIDLSQVGAMSHILTLNLESENDMEVAYINLTRTSSSVNNPISGEVGFEFSIYIDGNSHHPLYTATLPLPDTIVANNTVIDTTEADYRGHMSCTVYNNVSQSQKNLLVCEAYATNPSWPTPLTTPDDNLFSLILVTGKYIPEDPCANGGCGGSGPL
jgi:hypothetical protein